MVIRGTISDLQFGAGGLLGFKSRVGQIGQNVANDSPSLRRFFRRQVAQSLSLRDETRHASAQYREYNEDLIFFFFLRCTYAFHKFNSFNLFNEICRLTKKLNSSISARQVLGSILWR